MIVVVIVGIIAAIALPSYQDYARGAKRADAHEGLNHMAQLQERFFTENNAYATAASALGYTADATDDPPVTADAPRSKNGHWTLSVTAGGTAFALQAVPRGGHADPECLTITLDSTGTRSSTPAGNNCWSGK